MGEERGWLGEGQREGGRGDTCQGARYRESDKMKIRWEKSEYIMRVRVEEEEEARKDEAKERGRTHVKDVEKYM